MTTDTLTLETPSARKPNPFRTLRLHAGAFLPIGAMGPHRAISFLPVPTLR